MHQKKKEKDLIKCDVNIYITEILMLEPKTLQLLADLWQKNKYKILISSLKSGCRMCRDVTLCQ